MQKQRVAEIELTNHHCTITGSLNEMTAALAFLSGAVGIELLTRTTLTKQETIAYLQAQVEYGVEAFLLDRIHGERPPIATTTERSQEDETDH